MILLLILATVLLIAYGLHSSNREYDKVMNDFHINEAIRLANEEN